MMAQQLRYSTPRYAFSDPQLVGKVLCSWARVDRLFLIGRRALGCLQLGFHRFTGAFGQHSTDRPC
jgi:hypothetical protein